MGLLARNRGCSQASWGTTPTWDQLCKQGFGLSTLKSATLPSSITEEEKTPISIVEIIVIKIFIVVKCPSSRLKSLYREVTSPRKKENFLVFLITNYIVMIREVYTVEITLRGRNIEAKFFDLIYESEKSLG